MLHCTQLAHRCGAQLLEGFVGESLKSLKETTRQLAVSSKAEEGWIPQTATIIVPSGEGRMVILEAPPTAKFEVGQWGLGGR